MSDFLKHLPDSLQKLEPYSPGKTTAELKNKYGLNRIINLANNENPLGPSPKVKHAINEYLNNLAHYPEDAAPDLKQQLASLNAVSCEQIVLGSGSSDILDMVVRLFLHADDELIVSQYAYYHYQFLASITGGNTVIINAPSYHTDLNAITEAINNNTRLIIIANPNNPTGLWITADELFSFIRKVPSDVVVVIDEAYNEYMTEPKFKSAVELLTQHTNLIVVRTLSKAYGLAGLRFGYCITSKIIANFLNQIRMPFNVANIALIAASNALADQAYLEHVVSENQQARQQLSAFFTTMNLPMIAQSCNFITVEFGDNAARIALALEKLGILVRPLTRYNMPNHLRISVGTKEDNALLIKHLTAILASLDSASLSL